jgi:hypothetical protein
MLLMLLVAAAALDTASLKSDFRLQAARAGRGFSATPSARSKVSRLAADLEETQRASIVELAPTSSELLLGKWYLDWTDAADVLSLALLPNVALGDIVQEIARDQTTADHFVATNAVTFAPPPVLPFADALPSIYYAVEAACKPISATKLTLLFVGGRSKLAGGPVPLPALQGRLPTAVIDGLQNLFGERVFLETTFLDGDLRVARGPSRELYVLSKRDDVRS